MKNCKACKATKPLTEFYETKCTVDRRETECKACRKAKNRLNYRRSIEQRHQYEKVRGARPERRAQLREKTKRLNAREDYKPKNKTRRLTKVAIREGAINRQPCEVCGNPDAEIHHRDYSNPLDIQWLCLVHHRAAHGQIVTAHLTGEAKCNLKDAG